MSKRDENQREEEKINQSSSYLEYSLLEMTRQIQTCLQKKPWGEKLAKFFFFLLLCSLKSGVDIRKRCVQKREKETVTRKKQSNF